MIHPFAPPLADNELSSGGKWFRGGPIGGNGLRMRIGFGTPHAMEGGLSHRTREVLAPSRPILPSEGNCKSGPP